MKKLVVMLALVASLGGCNTIAGIGTDISAGANTVAGWMGGGM